MRKSDNCDQVTSSPEATIGSIPVAFLGVVWFLVALGLTLVTGQREDKSSARMVVAKIGWSLGGLLAIFYLIYAELFRIGAICLWCTVVHGLVIAVFLLALNDAAAFDEATVQETSVTVARRPRR